MLNNGGSDEGQKNLPFLFLPSPATIYVLFVIDQIIHENHL